MTNESPGREGWRTHFLSVWGKRALFILPIAAALLAFFSFARTSPSLELREESELTRALNTIAVPKLEVRPKVSGFGTAKYSRTWRAVAQVSGRLEEIHSELRPGSIINQGAVLAKIDDRDYQLVVQQSTAAIEQLNAELTQLEQTQINYESTLELEREVLDITLKELERAEGLLQRGAGSRSEVDIERREVLSQRQVIQELENSVRLIEPQKQALQAQIRQTEVQCEQAQRDIERTEILAPFTMRVGDVQLEVGQFVSENEELFTGYSFDEVEIEVQLSMNDIHRLFDAQTVRPPRTDDFTMDDVRKSFQLDAVIRVPGAGQTVTYRGRFLRVREIVNSQTRMVGLVVGVVNEREAEGPPHKPPLLEGAFCNVDLFGQSVGERVVVPLNAIRNSSLFVVDENNRLETKSVLIEFAQSGYAVLSDGMTGAERLIVSNPSPVIEGMLIDAVDDSDTQEALIELVRSDEPPAVANETP